MRKTIGLASIKNGHILLVKKKKTWIIPGGKPEPRETDIECLHREFKEELPGLKITNSPFSFSLFPNLLASGRFIVNSRGIQYRIVS